MFLNPFQHKKFTFFLVALLVLSIISAISIFIQIEKNHLQHEEQFKNMMLQEAISHFEDMLVARQWNAAHGGVYVKQENGLEPNPYLQESTIKDEHNQSYIKINPAWMTRQLSELSNKKETRYYKITSLKPLNPDNAPDTFEKEGLNYLQSHPQEKYFYANNVKRFKNKPAMFDFIGRLDTDQACLQCHAIQGYKLGDLRGGIRISLPTDKYDDSLNSEHRLYSFNLYLVSAFIAFLSLFIILILYLFYTEQSKLEYFNHLLKKTVDEKTQTLQEMNEQLESKITEGVLKNREKDELLIAQSRHAAMGEMIAMIAHQWRQPLSTITMDVNNMLVDIELNEIDKTALKEYAQGIIEQTEHLSHTIDDFRNFFRQVKRREPVLPSNVVNECFNILSDILKAHGINYHLNTEREYEVLLFSRELLQVLINLVNNAKDALIESTKENPNIDISIKQDEKGLNIFVQDNGPGIDANILDHIFEPYFTTKENKNGTGLGLYISKLIVEKNFNGTLSLETDSNGTCFHIHIPISKELNATAQKRD